MCVFWTVIWEAFFVFLMTGSEVAKRITKKFSAKHVKIVAFTLVGKLIMPRDQIFQDQCREISGAGPGISDFVA